MKILLKCPTRSRPKQVIDTLRKYVELADKPKLLGIAVSSDNDDASMHDLNVDYHIRRLPVAWVQIFFGDNKSKIEAVNADMDKITWDWDIVLLVSDDMIPQVKGYDDVIRSNMTPDRDRIIWVNDGNQGNNLNTISILGRTMYESFGYIYHPSYKSLYCDTEFTDLCKGSLADKCIYFPTVLIRHEHPGTGFPEKSDELYERNQKYWSEDMENYVSRKTYQYDWSIMIPTLVERSATFNGLMDRLTEKQKRICPDLKIEFCISCDNREKSVGAKRQELLQSAKGKYLSFIDDDDDVTDAYFEDAFQCIKRGFHACRLRGQMAEYTFTHSIENRLDTPLARDKEFLRPPNHLNIMLADFAKLVPFRNAVRGEDLDWTMRLARGGFIKTEYKSDPSRIHYIYELGDRKVDPRVIEFQKTSTYEKMLELVWKPSSADPVKQDSKKNGFKLTSRGFVSK